MNCTRPQRFLALVCLPVLVALATVARAQDAPTRTVTGTVRDTNGIPIPFVNVEGPRNLRVIGSEEGLFRIVLPTGGAMSLTLRRLGYRPVTVALPAGTDTALFVHLDLIPQQLNAVRVVTSAIQTLRNKGFYARMAEREQGASSGQFITPEEIELRNPSRPTQLLEGTDEYRRAARGQVQHSYAVLCDRGAERLPHAGLSRWPAAHTGWNEPVWEVRRKYQSE